MTTFDYKTAKIWYGNGLVDFNDARLHVASSAVLYGLSVYTVFPVNSTDMGMAAFRLKDHYQRLLESAKIIGIDTFAPDWDFNKFSTAVKTLVTQNHVSEDVFVRATIHADELVPGTRVRGLASVLSMFIYPAKPILQAEGARLKTSVWRRVPDYSIPARAKVNGAYVNSVLGKQDALDSGYDDCIFLDANGHVCELSAANIFLVRNGVLITPSTTSDILEGINRRSLIEIAQKEGITVQERTVDLTELYVADEAFACGTSALLAPITDVDGRQIGRDIPGPITKHLATLHNNILHGKNPEATAYLTVVN